MKPRLPLARLLGPGSARSYATKVTPRKPMTSERPPQKYADPLSSSPVAVSTPIPAGSDSDSPSLTFIHRPPPTSPSPFSYTTLPASPLLRTPAGHSPLGVPPYIRPSANKDPTPRLSDADLAELKRLRLEDPAKWTRAELARKFGCTKQFVALVASLPNKVRKERRRVKEEGEEAARARWGPRRRMVREVKMKKREFW